MMERNNRMRYANGMMNSRGGCGICGNSRNNGVSDLRDDTRNSGCGICGNSRNNGVSDLRDNDRSGGCGNSCNRARNDSRENGCGNAWGDTRSRSCGYGCSGNTRSDTKNRPNSRLLRELQKVDFSLIDLILYLDMYPDCEDSKQMYCTLQAQRQKLLQALAEDGYPISPQSVTGKFSDWTEGPWPWEYEEV